MDLSIIQIVIAILGGFLAGVINTLAGNGSAITLSVLTEVIGLPGTLANGTNRVGILFQSIASSSTLYNKSVYKISNSKLVVIVTCIGAIIGVIVATQTSNESFLLVFKILITIMLVVVLVRPKRWLHDHTQIRRLPLWISIPVFLAIGFYGGFIQMGMGVIFLAIMVLLYHYSLLEANYVKIVVVTLYTIVVVAIFQWQGLIDWKIGGIMAIGQTAGGYLAARFISDYPRADVWAYRLLVVIIVVVVLKTYGIINW